MLFLCQSSWFADALANRVGLLTSWQTTDLGRVRGTIYIDDHFKTILTVFLALYAIIHLDTAETVNSSAGALEI